MVQHWGHVLPRSFLHKTLLCHMKANRSVTFKRLVWRFFRMPMGAPSQSFYACRQSVPGILPVPVLESVNVVSKAFKFGRV